MKSIILAAGLLIYIPAMAQQESTSTNSISFFRQFAFHSINQMGLLEGEKGTSFQLQTINGVAKNYWFAGIGAGIDHYHLRTIPVFLDVRTNIIKKDKSPFIYADAGISFPWEKGNNNNLWLKNEYNNGRFFDVGIGYTTPLSKVGAFVFSIGYSEKKLTEERYNYFYIMPAENVYDLNKTEYNYCFRRISVKAGWQF